MNVSVSTVNILLLSQNHLQSDLYTPERIKKMDKIPMIAYSTKAGGSIFIYFKFGGFMQNI